MNSFDELWIPESEDVLGSGSDWAEGNKEVWQPEKEGALGTSRAECFCLLSWLLIEGEEVRREQCADHYQSACCQ